MNQKITAIIPTKNEEHNIEGVLQSVSFADEIMVVDSFSTDRTVELARKYTDFILQREYNYSASQKNWAIPQASNEWILLVDSDERITPSLREEIRGVLEEGTDKSAFTIHRINYFMGKPIKYSGWQNDRVTRLFKRDACRYEDKFVHAEIVTQGGVGKLKNSMLHHTYTNLKSFLEKMDRYATWSAYDRQHKVKNVNFFHLSMKPGYRFVNDYIFRLGILDGRRGFILSVISAYSVFLRYVKLMRLKENEIL
jgi:glycosyltransferase involved in cell wall biosynthesis